MADLFSALGTAAAIIGILEATVKTFEQIVVTAKRIHQFPETSSKIIRQCNFDSDTLRSIIRILTANPQVFENDDERISLEKAFYELQTDLSKAKARIEPYEEDNILRRVAWGLTGEKKLSEIERELFQWSQRLYVRFSVLLSRLQSMLRGSGKDSSTLLQIPEILSQQRMRELANQTSKIDKKGLIKDQAIDRIIVTGPPSSQMRGTVGYPVHTNVLIEYRAYDPVAGDGDRAEMEEKIARLAAIVSYVEPGLMNILRGYGYYHDIVHCRFGIICNTPPGNGEFVSLEDLIKISPQPLHSLNKRFELARRITAAVGFTHGVGWVHKAIRSRKVLFFAAQGSSVHDPRFLSTLGDAYLTGFEEARNKDGHSNFKESGDWRVKLYRHPDRHAEGSNTFFTPAHDIYSLGVVLLEIALWKPLADFSMIVKQGAGQRDKPSQSSTTATH